MIAMKVLQTIATAMFGIYVIMEISEKKCGWVVVHAILLEIMLIGLALNYAD